MARRLAEALVAGPWRREDLVDRGRAAVGGRTRWHGSLVGRLLAAFGSGSRPCSARVAAFLSEDRGFLRAYERLSVPPRERAVPLDPVMWPAERAPSSWIVPSLTSSSQLAAYLGIGWRELEWLADRHGRERESSQGDSCRYSYRWVAKRFGSSRLIEVPGSRLRTLQRRLLRDILDNVPPHDAAHGFRAGRSVGTFVKPHVGRRVVLKLDLSEFFPTISGARVLAAFLAIGYPEPVARLLAGLCVNTAPSWAWNLPLSPPRTGDGFTARRRYQVPHLPQGAPTSPALANLCAHRLDARLAGFASAAGAAYTRYADDLAFSGDEAFARAVDRIPAHVGAIALEEGFAVNTRKTRIMRRGVRQRVAGVVINERPNVPRSDYDALKAILQNCVVRGIAGQNRRGHADFRAHLRGRIGHVGSLNPARGDRLRAIFDRIDW